MQCTAKSKRTGERCKNHAIRGRETCRFHGGTHKRGYDNPRTITGSQSKYLNYLPQNLRNRYDDLLNDKSLRNLDDRIAILDLRLSQLLSDTEHGDYGSLYTQIQNRAYSVQKLLDKCQRVASSKREETFNELLDEFEDLSMMIQTGQSQYQTWQEIRSTINDIKGLVKAISDIEYQGEKAVTLKELAQFMAGITKLIQRANLDTEQARFLSEGLMTLWNYQYQIEDKESVEDNE